MGFESLEETVAFPDVAVGDESALSFLRIKPLKL